MRSDRALARWREAEAVQMRLAGLDYQSIAVELGYRTRSAAWKAVNRALERRVAERVDTYRLQAIVDLDILQNSAWKSACAGDSRSIQQCLRAIDQRAKVAGLYSRPGASRRANGSLTATRRRRPTSSWREADEPLVPHEPASSSEGGEGWDVSKLVVLKERAQFG